MNQNEIFIDKKIIASVSEVYVIAEVGINHDGSASQAHKLIDAAADSGADAVKFQTFRADRLMTPGRDRLSHQEAGAESAYEMFHRLELSLEDHENLKRHASDREISFLSTPFDEESADFLDRLGVPAFKIASSDITHTPLLKHVAAKGKPIILSTGMSYLSEVADALWMLKSAGAKEILLMHCVSMYPAPPDKVNLRAIHTLRNQFEMLVGYSDHTQGITVPLAAAVVGAVAIEKHFTLDKALPGPDHKASMDPGELRTLVQSLKEIVSSLGDGRKRPTPEELKNREGSRRSVVAAVDIRAHETIAPWMLACKRPMGGIEPKEVERIVGMHAKHNIQRDTIITWTDLMPSAFTEKPGEDATTESSGRTAPQTCPNQASKSRA
jgi:N,N'-diacetyllegionaminate synthase